MTYFVLGLLLLVFGSYFLRSAIKQHDKEGIIGFTAIVIAALILLIFFGLFLKVIF